MSRENSPCIVGDYWLDRRRGTKTSEIWQIAHYDANARSIRYRSTHRKHVDEAKAVIHAYVEALRSRQPQRAEDATLVAQLVLYWSEKAKRLRSAPTIAGSIRAFIGFLLQDEAGPGVTVAALNPNMFERFRVWRMGPHEFTVPWDGDEVHLSSPGVTGESVSTNLDYIRAALGHAASHGRIPYAPKIPAIAHEHRSPPRDLVLTTKQLGAIMAFTAEDKPMFRFLALILGTAVRPEAALKMNPAKQFDETTMLIDLHPPGNRRTKKHNPVVPVIPQLATVLKEWGTDEPVKSRKTAWRTLRRALDLPPAAEPKTIRHTIATRLRGMGVPAAEVSGLLGHQAFKGVTNVYAKYDPAYLKKAKAALSKIWNEVMAEATRWSAVHLRSKVGNNRLTVVAKKRVKS